MRDLALTISALLFLLVLLPILVLWMRDKIRSHSRRETPEQRAAGQKRGRIRMEGAIKWFSNSKGYGFIGCENGPDVFVHYSGIVGDGWNYPDDYAKYFAQFKGK